ncbi:MAG TPA: pyrimidine-nucleoside phosphorylase, partial [Bacilli bacterium]|nr:pyrimidine-nucleoside phosphorylase [Bacilli bacterium]
MSIIEIINKKRNNNKLTFEEIKFVINSYIRDEIKDYQMSSLLMAICINGMDSEETYYLTECMLNSGDKINLSSIPGIKVDKHSTGGVGDKTTLIVAPIVASLGVPVAKMSG